AYCEVGRYCEPYPHRAAVAGVDGGVDTEQPPFDIDQRAAGIARIDGGVGLDEVVIGGQAQAVATHRADDALGDRLAETEGVADGQYQIADPRLVRLADADRFEPGHVDLQYREVGFGIHADHLRQGFAAIVQQHQDLIGAADDVVVGQQVAVAADDHRRSQA